MGLAARASWNLHCDKEEVLSEDHIRDFHRIRDKCSKISSKDEAAANGMSWDFKNWTAIPGRVWHDETPADVATLVARPFSPVHHTEPAIALTLSAPNRKSRVHSHAIYSLALHLRSTDCTRSALSTALHCYRLHQHPPLTIGQHRPRYLIAVSDSTWTRQSMSRRLVRSLWLE